MHEMTVSTYEQVSSDCSFLCLTYGSKTMRVMYSLGMRGSWCENTLWSPTSHSRIWSLGSVSSVLLMTWNSMMPRFSSRRAASSRVVCAVNRLVCCTRTVTLYAEFVIDHTIPYRMNWRAVLLSGKNVAYIDDITPSLTLVSNKTGEHFLEEHLAYTNTSKWALALKHL